jgi:hypothetical protein
MQPSLPHSVPHKDSVDNCCSVSQPTCHNMLNLNAAKHFTTVLPLTAEFYYIIYYYYNVGL